MSISNCLYSTGLDHLQAAMQDSTKDCMQHMTMPVFAFLSGMQDGYLEGNHLSRQSPKLAYCHSSVAGHLFAS